ncbi:YceI family protein [Thiomicrorhabdus sp. 6S2-11]|jgi:polyisoprenoid-binding protein YceI|uniref:YceI family protein n=1 Tax=Thiomicrorhabdus marina TaxID=2818442 RepID=A0ABS3Q722_9GAMM|nr:YceI family protein [Thiomicrorhabdus marina]MBO1928159.1 YceI family protein [Thiomicrorhabdus marina]
MQTLNPSKLLAVFTLSTGLLLSTQAAQAANYQIDSQGMHAAVQFKIKHLGYSWLNGRFDNFKGNFEYDANKPNASSVEVEIDTTSLNSNHAERDKHLRSADFLNASKYPKAKFVSTSISESGDGIAVKGKLTLNGVTKPLTIEAEKIGEGKDPWGGYRAGFTGTTSFKLADYGITYDLGPASTEVFMTLDIEGVRQ